MRSSSGPGHPRGVALNLLRGAGAVVLGVTHHPARTRIHRRCQHKPRRKGESHGGSGNGDLGVFERLPQHFQYAAAKFGKLIEEQNPVVRQTGFTRCGDVAAADEPGIGG